MINRREFLRYASAAGGVLSFAGPSLWPARKQQPAPLFKISLAEWSLHRSIFDERLDHLEFAVTARQKFDIGAVEYVNQFFMGKAEDTSYLREMEKRASGEGVESLLIMIDQEGDLGDPSDSRRTEAVNNHIKWIEAAKELGCHSIRVNARSDSELSATEQKKIVVDGLRQLSEYGGEYGINILVENHGGLSSNGKWLVDVIESVDHPRCGTMPDFGNFVIREGDSYDPYKGVRELMPYAKAVSAEALDFDENGHHVQVDYLKMLRIVTEAGYDGYIGIEYEGDNLSEIEGIRKAKKRLEKVRDEL